MEQGEERGIVDRVESTGTLLRELRAQGHC